MITFEITSVNIAYQNNTVSGVNVNFFATHVERTINLNGYIPLTFEEYTPIANDVEALKEEVKKNVVDLIEGTEA